jgi:aspartate carbamoyltransferase catalytic subunit
VHSLVRALSKFPGVELGLVSPPFLRLPADLMCDISSAVQIYVSMVARSIICNWQNVRLYEQAITTSVIEVDHYHGIL